MDIREYINRGEGYYVAPEVKYACEFLEYHGEIMNLGFRLDNAITKAAEMYCVRLDEDLWGI